MSFPQVKTRPGKRSRLHLDEFPFVNTYKITALTPDFKPVVDTVVFEDSLRPQVQQPAPTNLLVLEQLTLAFSALNYEHQSGNRLGVRNV
jgi:hypothetical protein